MNRRKRDEQRRYHRKSTPGLHSSPPPARGLSHRPSIEERRAGRNLQDFFARSGRRQSSSSETKGSEARLGGQIVARNVKATKRIARQQEWRQRRPWPACQRRAARERPSHSYSGERTTELGADARRV